MKAFKVGNRVWLQLNKERLQGHGKKIKALRYGSFEILEKVTDNAYIINIHPYMHIYSVVNVENLKLYEPSQGRPGRGPSHIFCRGFGTRCSNIVEEDTSLQKRCINTRQGKHDLWQIGLKGQLLGKVKWYT